MFFLCFRITKNVKDSLEACASTKSGHAGKDSVVENPIYKDFYRIEFKKSKSLKLSINSQFQVSEYVKDLDLNAGAVILRIDGKSIVRKGFSTSNEYIKSKPIGTTISLDIIPNGQKDLKANTLSNVSFD